METITTLTSEVTAALAAAELRQAARTPAGDPVPPGFTVDPFPGTSPARVAVTWHYPWGQAAVLGCCRCLLVLTQAGYRAVPVGIPGRRVYLMVFSTPASEKAATATVTAQGNEAVPR